MKYIKKVILENFQSHKNTTIKFDRGLNIIVGASDSGKTSILRGIKWALYNEPSGDYFIREEESECSVTIFFSDNTKIKRYRSKSKNSYFTYDQNDNEKKYEGFGTSVPDEVLNITGIKKILLDKDTSKSINISNQLEGAFLLSEKSSIKANSIGYLVGVDIVDDALRDTLKDNRNLSNKQKHIDQDINELKDELSEYEYLEELNRKIKKIEEIGVDIDSKTKILNIYKKILDNKTDLKNEKQRINYYLNKLKDLQKIEIAIKDFELKYNLLALLSNHKENLDKTQSNKNYNLNLIESLKNINKLDATVDLISNLQKKQTELQKINIKLEKNTVDRKETKSRVERLYVLNKIIPKVSLIEENMVELKSLNKLESKKSAVSKNLYKGNSFLKKMENIDVSEDKFNILNKKIRNLDKFNKFHISYIDNTKHLNKCKEYLKENKIQIEKLSEKYKKALLLQKTCPLCFSDIDNEKAEYIIKQYK